MHFCQWGTEIVEAALQSIPSDQVKNPYHNNLEYSLYCWNGDHTAFSSIMRTEKKLHMSMFGEDGGYDSTTAPCFTSVCWSRMEQCVWKHGHKAISRCFAVHMSSHLHQTSLSRNCITKMYCSLFTAAHLWAKSFHMISVLLKYLQNYLYFRVLLVILCLLWECWWFPSSQLALYLLIIQKHNVSSPTLVMHECGSTIHRCNKILTNVLPSSCYASVSGHTLLSIITSLLTVASQLPRDICTVVAVSLTC